MNISTQKSIDKKLANTVVELKDPLVPSANEAYTAANSQKNAAETMSA